MGPTTRHDRTRAPVRGELRDRSRAFWARRSVRPLTSGIAPDRAFGRARGKQQERDTPREGAPSTRRSGALARETSGSRLGVADRNGSGCMSKGPSRTTRRGRLSGTRPSFTARGIAHVRARLNRPLAVTGDPHAGALLAKELGMPLPLQPFGTFVSYVRGRTQFFDSQVVDAVGAAPGQVVIIGAGYDDRALRFRTPDIRFIEVDHPATQDDKRRRLARLGVDVTNIVFVPVDFEADTVNTKVDQVLDPTLATTIICEGVLPYLTRPSVDTLLRSLSRCAGSPVRLAVDLPVMPESWAGRATFTTFRIYAAAAGERVRTVLRRGEVSPLLEGAGWKERRRVSGKELGMSASRSETMFVVADATRAE
jgi:methyltransferase (TIGR00027 family)